MNVNARIEPVTQPISLDHDRLGKSRPRIEIKKSQVSIAMALAVRIRAKRTTNNCNMFLRLSFIRTIIDETILLTRRI